MGFLQYLGLDDLADSVNEFTTEMDSLRNEIVDSVVGPTEELKNTVDDITGSLTDSTDASAQSSSKEN